MTGPVGKVVIAVLLAASLWCWVVIIESVIGVIRFKAALRRWRQGDRATILGPVAEAGRAAAERVVAGEPLGDRRARVTQAMNSQARTIVAAVEGGLPNLAIIASVAPFAGLFGTVWGIMSSFLSIAHAKDTSLAVVAPGIAEALATTAMGLAAAIPASAGYTRAGAAIGRAARQLGGLIEDETISLTAPAAVQPHDEQVV